MEYKVYIDGELACIVSGDGIGDIIDIYPILYPDKKVTIVEFTEH